MKICIVFIFLILFHFSGFCTEISPYINLNQKNAIDNRVQVSFMGRTYTFGFGNEVLNEYFPVNETPNHFSSLIGLYVFKNNTDPILVAQTLYDKLLADNQAAHLAIHRQSKEPSVTFILKTAQGFELNLWRFYRNPDRTEIIGMQYLHTFKAPSTQSEQERLQRLIQTTGEQFMLLPKMTFIW